MKTAQAGNIHKALPSILAFTEKERFKFKF
jgi:hypothetical protein